MMRLTSANGLQPGPNLVSLAPPHRLPDDHIPVVALVAEHHHDPDNQTNVTIMFIPDQRVVGDAVVHDPAKWRIDRNRTRNRCNLFKNHHLRFN